MDPVTRLDRTRQLTVTGCEVLCVLGTLVGTGVIGTRVAESSGGALAADATLLAPAGPAFSIWSVVYAGLAAYTVAQWLPGWATSPRMRRTGWPAALSMLLNAGWLLVTQQGWIWTSVAVIVALAATLAVLVRRLTALPATSAFDRLVVDGTFGLYLGWVGVAVLANLSAALATSDLAVPSGVAEAAAAAALIAVAVLGALAAVTLAGRWAVALAGAWGLAWIAVGRLSDAPGSTVTAAAALLAAVVVVAATLAVRTGRLAA